MKAYATKLFYFYNLFSLEYLTDVYQFIVINGNCTICDLNDNKVSMVAVHLSEFKGPFISSEREHERESEKDHRTREGDQRKKINTKENFRFSFRLVGMGLKGSFTLSESERKSDTR